MRRSYGTGHVYQGPSILSWITLLVALLAVGLSIFIILDRDPAANNKLAELRPNQSIAPTIIPSPAPSAEPPAPPASRPPASPDAGRPPTVTHRPACRNSYKPACGRFYWSPAPARDLPLNLRVTMFPDQPFVGEEVTFTVQATDGDAGIRYIQHYFGEGLLAHYDCRTALRYGAWTPPARQAGSKTITLRHTYTKAGTYKASFTTRSGDCDSPYGSVVNLPIDVVVTAAS